MDSKTDKEILILAAKAFGLVDYVYMDTSTWDNPSGVIYSRGRGCWDPLVDNGQAFELMVYLKFSVEHVYDYGQRVMGGNGEYWAVVPYNGDPIAVTRRAIVMAAAKLAEGSYGH